MKEGRWYQTYCTNKINSAIEDGFRRIHVDLPTGAGKTFTAALTLNDAHFRHLVGVEHDEPLRVFWVAHKHRLLSQARKEIEDTCINVEVHLQSAFSPITVDVKDFHVVVIDECHHEAMMSIQLKLDDLCQRPIIGLTATDERADGTLIKFDYTVRPLTRMQAVEEGWLAKTTLRTIVDYSSTKQKHESVIKTLEQFHSKMGQTMVFMPYRSQVMAVTEFLQNLGYTAIALLDQGAEELDAALDAFSRGDVKFLVNCNKINEGVDVRGCTDVVLGRQYGSEPELNQVIGRAARPDSPCNVWEFLHPLKQSLTALTIVGVPELHELYSRTSKGEWEVHAFDYDDAA